MFRHNSHLLLFTFTCLFSIRTAAQPGIQYRPVIQSLNSPLDIVNAGDKTNRLFVVEKEGVVKVFDSSYHYLGNFLQLFNITTQGERGLLSLAFHPQFETNGFLFALYTNNMGDIEIARYQVAGNPNKADTSTKKVIITIPHRNASNHNGGKMNFGPDGYLYFATGDGGGAGDTRNNAQNGLSLLGKMIRIDIDQSSPPLNYRIPPDNPYVDDPLVADEIWAIGLRNPWRWSFDRLTGDMWIGDVGQNLREEINMAKAGQHGGINYGWRCYEGKNEFNTAGCATASLYRQPVFDYPRHPHTGGWVVTGGYVYRGAAHPSLNGYYIFADYGSSNQWTIRDSAGEWVIQQQPSGNFPRNIAAFGEDENGSLYACALPSGVIYKLEASTGVAFQLLQFRARANNSVVELEWMSSEQDISHYELERSTDSINFTRIAAILAKNQGNNNFYTHTDLPADATLVYYRLRVVNVDGRWDYSSTIAVRDISAPASFIFPSIISNQVISSFVPVPGEMIEVFQLNGQLVARKFIKGMTGRIDILVPQLARGIYLVRISGNGKQALQRILVL